jgi:integrase
VTLADGKRPLVPLDPTIPHEDEARARACAAVVSAEARAIGGVSVLVRETVAEFTTRWLPYRRERGITSVDDDKGRLRKWVLPIIGAFDVRRVGREDLEDLVCDLDARVRRGELSWKTAVHAWSLVTKLFDDATACKRRELRVRSDNPAKDVRGPDTGARKAKVYLYPAEFAKLMACDAVPVDWRRAFAVTTYLFLRAGEANALTWDEVDLDHATVHVHRSVNRRTGDLSSTKSEAARRVPIDAALMPLLRAMHTEAGGSGRVLATKVTDRKLSRQLRRCLRLSGVTRADLFDDDEAARTTRKAITFHDLRATGITWSAVREDAPLTIMQRAGHRSFSTTQGYIREAENLRAGFGEPFPPLPAAVIGAVPEAVYTGEPVVCTAASASAADPDPDPDPTVLAAIVAVAGQAEPSEVSSPGFGFVTRGATGALKNRAPRWRRRESKPVDLGHNETRTVVNPPDSDAGASSPRDETERPKPDVTSAVDAVETALADALTKATTAERWDVVAQLARELEARRLARSANVVVLAAERRRDGGAR